MTRAALHIDIQEAAKEVCLNAVSAPHVYFTFISSWLSLPILRGTRIGRASVADASAEQDPIHCIIISAVSRLKPSPIAFSYVTIFLWLLCG